MASNLTPWWEKPENVPWAASKRFGLLAYVAPVESWPTVQNIIDYFGKGRLAYTETTPGNYEFTYTRTGRNLGNVQSIAGNRRIAPWVADQILDYADYLDQVDPNYYHYNLQNRNTPSNALAQSMVNLTTPKDYALSQGTVATPTKATYDLPGISILNSLLGQRQSSY